MKMLRYDSVGGASGDMILASLIGLGADAARLESELKKLDLGHFHIEVKEAESHHLHGTRVWVHVDEEHHHDHSHSHPHRTFRDIRALLRNSSLPAAVRERSLAVFSRLAEAEAKVHHTTPDLIHFHEVGAVDSIVDIVGSCLALEWLGVGAVSVGPLPVGQGTVTCAHGVFPIPAPATVELLGNHTMVRTEEPFEMLTPTGAALLTTWHSGSEVPDACRVIRTAHAIGHQQLHHRPNLLRASLLESEEAEAGTDNCLVLESEIDDSTPELLGVLIDRLLAAGMLDAYATAVQMKKQRPGMLLTVLCRPDQKDDALDLIFTESTTFGVRQYAASRTILPRRMEPVATPYGEIRVKVGSWRGREITSAPELEDCRAAAAKAGVAVRAVYEAAQAAARRMD